MPKQKLKVVVVGGGNGTAIVLDALKRLAGRLEISAVVSTSDSGGSSGAMRQEFKILPPGDIMRAVIALSPYDYKILKKIFYKNRITSLSTLNSKLKTEKAPNLGNLFMLFVSQFEGDFVRAVRALEEAVEAVGHSHPVTLEQTDLCMALDNGAVIKGEASVDRPTYDRQHKIIRAWLEPEAKIYLEAEKVLATADAIILAPGSLYCSVVATLLPAGVKEAIGRSSARLIYVAGDAYEKIGETGPEKLSEFVSQLERYLPRPLDVVVYNNATLSVRQKQLYRERHWGTFAKDVANIPKSRQLVSADFESAGGGLSSEKLSAILKKILLV